MSLNAKPFSAAEKIRNRNYLPSPGRITSVDLNQEKEAMIASSEFLSKFLGSYQDDFTFTVNTLALVKTTGPTTYTLTYNIDFGGTNRRVFGRTVRFDAPALNFTAVRADTIPPLIEWWLIAKKETIDFATDPVMAGVNGPGFPSALSSSDAVVWGSEDIIEVTSNPPPALGLGFEYVCKVGSVIYRDERHLATASDWVPVFVSLPDSGNSTGDALLDLHGIQSLQPEGSKPTSLGEVIQRLSLTVGTWISKIPLLSRFSGIISSNTDLTLTTADIKKQIYFQSHTTEVTCELPLINNPALLDLSTYSIYNYGNYAVIIKPLSGTIMGAPYYYLSSKDEHIEIVYDKANTNWKVVSSSIKRRFVGVITTAVSAVLNSSDFNKIVSVEGMTGPCVISLPFTNAISGTNLSHVGQTILIKHKTAGVYYSTTVNPFIGGTIDGAASFTLYADGDYVEVMVTDAATNAWTVVSQKVTNPNYFFPKLTVGVGLAPAFQNSWAAIGSTSFRKTLEGFVLLEGGVTKNTTATGVIYTLPSGYRPATTVSIPCVIIQGGVFVNDIILIATSGDISLSTGAAAASTQIYFNSIIFPTT